MKRSSAGTYDRAKILVLSTLTDTRVDALNCGGGAFGDDLAPAAFSNAPRSREFTMFDRYPPKSVVVGVPRLSR